MIVRISLDFGFVRRSPTFPERRFEQVLRVCIIEMANALHVFVYFSIILCVLCARCVVVVVLKVGSAIMLDGISVGVERVFFSVTCGLLAPRI